MADILGKRHALHAIVNAVAQECGERCNHTHSSIGIKFCHELDILKCVKEEMRVKLRFELSQLRDHTHTCPLFIFLHQPHKTLYHAVVLACDLLELVPRLNDKFPFQIPVAHGAECGNNLIHCARFLCCLAAYAEKDQRHHEEEHGKENRCPRRELRDAAADGQNRVDGEMSVQYRLLHHVELLPFHLDQPMCIRNFRHDLVKDGVAKDRHGGKRRTSGAIRKDNVYLLAGLKALRQFLHGHNEYSIALRFHRHRPMHLPHRKWGMNRLTDNIVPFMFPTRDKFLNAALCRIHA